MGNVDPATTGRRLKAEIDTQVEAMQDAGFRPACIVVDMPSYQAWCLYRASERIGQNDDPWSDGGDMDLQPETEYRDIPIVAIPQLQRVVAVTVDMRESWDDLDTLMKVVA